MTSTDTTTATTATTTAPVVTHEPTEIEKLIKAMDPKQGELFVLTTLRKNIGNQKALEELGIKMEVRIFRLTKENGAELIDSQGLLPTRELNAKASELAEPLFQLRIQHALAATQASAEHKSAEAQAQAFERVMRSNYLAPKGGYVRVEIVNPLNGKTYEGEYHFKHNAMFCKEKAKLAAFGKTYSRILADSSMGRVRGKRVINELVK